jgi:hypothetical protein
MNTLQHSAPLTASPRSLGTLAPEMPVTGTQANDQGRRYDPSSDRRAGSYPIPSFFEYREGSGNRDFF